MCGEEKDRLTRVLSFEEATKSVEFATGGHEGAATTPDADRPVHQGCDGELVAGILGNAPNLPKNRHV